MAMFTKTTKKEQKQQRSPRQATSKTSTTSVSLIRRHRITEKAMLLSAHNQYIFDVDKNATKNEVKKQIQKLYNVSVLNVRSIVGEKKAKHIRGVVGRQSITKKMIVTIPEGQKIDLGAR